MESSSCPTGCAGVNWEHPAGSCSLPAQHLCPSSLEQEVGSIILCQDGFGDPKGRHRTLSTPGPSQVRSGSITPAMQHLREETLGILLPTSLKQLRKHRHRQYNKP